MIPNRGYQQLVSFGFFAELGPLSIQFKPESVYAEIEILKDFQTAIIMQFGHRDIGVCGIRLTFQSDLEKKLTKNLYLDNLVYD